MLRPFLLILLFLTGFLNDLVAQPLFLPQNLNTSKNDHPVGFTEFQNAYYFVGTQWPTQAADASSGFCYQTDELGNTLQTFQLSGLDSQKAYTFEAVYSYNDQIYILATAGHFQNDSFLLPAGPNSFSDGYFYDKVLLLRLDLNLNLRRVDTLQYDTDSTDIETIKSAMIGGKIFAAYSSVRKEIPSWTSTYHYVPHAFISVYDINSSSFTHQPIDSTFLASGGPATPFSDAGMISSITRTGDDQLLVGCFLIPANHFEAFPHVLQMDTNLTITALPLANNYSFQTLGTGIPEFTMELWKPTATSSYFTGPVFYHYDTTTNLNSYSFLSLGRLDSGAHLITLGAPVPVHPYRQEGYMPARKNAMTLLQDKAHFIVSRDAYTYNTNAQPGDTARIRIAKYDTSLNLLWNRDFGKPYSSFTTAGVYELSNGKLMVISAAIDYIAGGTTDLHCFIIDSNGTPLNTFTVATPAQKGVKIYPNPTQGAIRFDLPAGQTTATYRITDIQGKTVLQGTYNSGNTVSVQALPAANYLFRVETADKVWHSGVFTKN